MPHGKVNNGSNISYQGTNSQGNRYTVYSDGRYHYSNPPQGDRGTSHYYNAGNGHSFYRESGPNGYCFHENANQGFRNYKFKNSGESNSNESSSGNVKK